MIVANIIIAVFGLIGTLAAFGGETWMKGSDSLLKRIKKRGWIALVALLITFTTGILKEIKVYQNTKLANQKRIELEKNNEEKQKRIDLQLDEIKTLQAKLDSATSNLVYITDKIGSQQLASIEAAFKLAIKSPRETDDAYLRLDGRSRMNIPSRVNDYMQLYWGDQFHFVIFLEFENIQASDLRNLKLKVGDREYPLHDGTSNGLFEKTIRIYGHDPRPMVAEILNPDRLRNVDLKIFVRTTDSSQGQEEFRKLILNSPFSEFAKKTYKRTTADILYVRANPSSNAQIRSSLAKGSFVRVLQTQDEWNEIITPEGRQGWVISKFLGEIE